MGRRQGGCGCLGCLLLLAATAGLAIFLGIHFTDAETPADLWDKLGDPRDFLPTWEDFFEEDPFNQYNASDPSEVPAWDNRGQGLTLELINALEERWDPYFATAVQEWDAGNPNVLELTTSRIAADPSCAPMDGKMKVCNADFGETRWKGLNEVAFDSISGEILVSVAKMNEYYLLNAGDAKKQYTMCHEIGHGFGLPHTDESFYNRDTGECMDYTERFENNKSPGPENFAYLEQMYGIIPGRRRRRLRQQNVAATTQPSLSATVRRNYERIVALLEANREDRVPNLRRLSSTQHRLASVVEVDLGENVKLQVRKLLVSDTEED